MMNNRDENRFVELISNIPNVAVQGYDKERKVIYWNRASEDIYGYTKEEALGKRLEDLIIPDFMREGVVEAIKNWHENGEAIPSSELPLLHKDGSTVFVYSSHVMLRAESEEPEMFCVDINLTLQKEAQAEIKRINSNLQSEIDLQLTELRAKDEQLLQQSKLSEMGDMINMIAHQWRQPLNAISATGINLSILSNMGKLDAKKIETSSEFIQDQCQKMSVTIDTFMNFLKPTTESKEFKVSHALDSVIHIMGIQLSDNNITLSISSLDNTLSIVGYEDLLKQVIINILSNSRDAFIELDSDNGTSKKQEDRYIDIVIYLKDDVIVISIEDNAGGIATSIREKIFNPYFTTKEQGIGIGIGLYMGINIMKNSFNGDLKYTPMPSGSRFEIVCGPNKQE